MENNLPKDYEQLAAWFGVIRRAMRDMSIGNQTIVTMTIICDEKRNPVWWAEPKVSQLEPRARKIDTKEM